MHNKPSNRQALHRSVMSATRRSISRRRMWLRRRQAMERLNHCYTPLGIKGRRGSRLFEMTLDWFEAFLRLTGLFQIGHRNAHQIRVREIKLTFPELPEAFIGYKILHLTDLHLDSSLRIEQAIIAASAGHAPDLCVLTGDFRHGDDGPFEQIMLPMGRLLNGIGARDGYVAVLGNHDDHAMGLAFEDRLGIHLLVNERLRIRRGPDKMILTGTDDVNRFYSSDATAALVEPLDGFGIALVHSPEMAHEAARGGHSLYLCGHTHGGQVALPGGWPIITHLHRNRDLVRGLWKVGNMVGYTSPGSGVSGPTVRFNTRGEVTLFTLERRRSSQRPSP